MGGSYWKGLSLAKYPWVALIPGSNLFYEPGIHKMFEAMGASDMVLTYIENDQLRPLGRQWLSSFYTHFLNTIFGLHVHYYNGPTIFRRKDVLEVMLPSRGHGYMSAIVVQLLKKGCSYVELPIRHEARKYSSSRLLRGRNISSILHTLFILGKRVYGAALQKWAQRLFGKKTPINLPESSVRLPK